MVGDISNSHLTADSNYTGSLGHNVDMHDKFNSLLKDILVKLEHILVKLQLSRIFNSFSRCYVCEFLLL